MQFSEIAIVLSAFSAVSARTISTQNEPAIAPLVEVEILGIETNDNADLDASTPQHYYTYPKSPLGVSKLVRRSGTLLTSPRQYAQFYGNGSWTTSNTRIYENLLYSIGGHAYLGKSRSLGAGVARYTKGSGRKIINGGSSAYDLSTTSKLNSKIVSVIGTYGESQTGQNMYHFLPDTVKSSKIYGYGTRWCGYHGEGTSYGKKFTYSVNGIGNFSGCKWWTENIGGVTYSTQNGLSTDYQISVLAHEIAEMITDPWVQSGNAAWTDNSSPRMENADKCNGMACGFNKITSSRKMYNAYIGGSRFFIQQSYDNDYGSYGRCPNNVW